MGKLRVAPRSVLVGPLPVTVRLHSHMHFEMFKDCTSWELSHKTEKSQDLVSVVPHHLSSMLSPSVSARPNNY